jgi:hypothetical protein
MTIFTIVLLRSQREIGRELMSQVRKGGKKSAQRGRVCLVYIILFTAGPTATVTKNQRTAADSRGLTTNGFLSFKRSCIASFAWASRNTKVGEWKKVGLSAPLTNGRYCKSYRCDPTRSVFAFLFGGEKELGLWS